MASKTVAEPMQCDGFLFWAGIHAAFNASSKLHAQDCSPICWSSNKQVFSL